MVRVLPLSVRAAATARWCTCSRAAVAVCLGNLVAVLLVARALYPPGYIASAPKCKPRPFSQLSVGFTFTSCLISESGVPVALAYGFSDRGVVFEGAGEIGGGVDPDSPRGRARRAP
jgi:hypothetical protein